MQEFATQRDAFNLIGHADGVVAIIQDGAADTVNAALKKPTQNPFQNRNSSKTPCYARRTRNIGVLRST
jgi:hypothetical protein